MNEFEQKLSDLENKLNALEQKSKRYRRSWYSRNLASITFFGYLAATVIGGISLIYSHSFSKQTIKEYKHQDSLNQVQFNHLLRKDSILDKIAKSQTLHQDSLNRHQDSLNRQQLGYFKNQTQTGKEQLSYFRAQTMIADTQLRNAEIIYQEQQTENKPFFVLDAFKTDSTKDKTNPSLQYNITNAGRRIAYIKKVTTFFWNPESTLLSGDSPPVGGEGLLPTAHSTAYVPIDQKIGLSKTTVIMVRVFYEDKLIKGIQTFTNYYRCDKVNPIVAVQVDEDVQNLFIKRIEQAENNDKKSYFTYKYK